MRRKMQKKREFFIMTASIGEGHSQAARAIAETIKQVHSDDAFACWIFCPGMFFPLITS